MSALALALAAFASSLDPVPHVSAPAPTLPKPAGAFHPTRARGIHQRRSLSPSNPVPRINHSSPPAATPINPFTNRTNEHLAVLLPKNLWKPDYLASHCDNFFCRAWFSIFERRHHCRKCGGIFCNACSSQNTPLLDTSNLEFLHPPRNSPLASFESPISPIIPSRVCDDCWDQIHGCPTSPRTPDVVRPSFKRALTHPIVLLKLPRPISPSISEESSLASSIIATPPDSCTLTGPSFTGKAHSLRASPSASSLRTNASVRSSPAATRRNALRIGQLPLTLDLERSYGELDAYPLRRSSVLCKATGGGRWEPKHSPILVGYRPPVPGGKAPFEVEMEREEKEEKARRDNPIVCDGDFKYRVPREPSPPIMYRSPLLLSTF